MSALLHGERDAIGLTAVFSVGALVGTRENPRAKIISYVHRRFAHAGSRITSVLPTNRKLARVAPQSKTPHRNG